MAILDEVLSFQAHNPTDLPVAACLEVSGPNPLTDSLLGLALVGHQNSFCYFDLRPDAHEQKLAAGFLGAYPLALFNAPACLTWLNRLGIQLQVAADPLLMAFSLDPTAPLDLAELARRHLNMDLGLASPELLEAGILWQPSDELLPLPIVKVGSAILSLTQALRDLPDWAEAVYRQEMALVPVVADMQLRGIAVELATLDAVAAELAQKVSALHSSVTQAASRAGYRCAD